MKKQLSLLSIVLSLSFVLSACGPGQMFGPTLTPTPTFTPSPTSTPTPLPGPKAGHWVGDHSISFEVGADGKLHDFKMEIDFGNGTCNVLVEDAEIASDGTFKFTFGDPKLEDENVIQGKFDTNVTVSGIYSKDLSCANYSGQIAFMISLEDHPWKAEWNGQ